MIVVSDGIEVVEVAQGPLTAIDRVLSFKEPIELLYMPVVAAFERQHLSQDD